MYACEVHMTLEIHGEAALGWSLIASLSRYELDFNGGHLYETA